MLKEPSVNLCNLLLSLSDAVDLASPTIATHQIRTAFIAWQMAVQGGLSDASIEKLFIAALFHDIGALSPEDKVDLHKFECRDITAHCIWGEALFRLSPFFSPAAGIVRHHHTPWKKWDSLDATDALESQILNLADHLERHIRRDVYILHQRDALTDAMVELSGTLFHKDIVALFTELSVREDFWLDIVSPRLFSTILCSGPFSNARISIRDTTTLASIFRNIIDFRSVFTATHSTGVAECVRILAGLFGFNDAEVSKMELAGNFHDIGKMAVPNAILNKPGRLSREEFAIVKQHTYFTYNILRSIGGLDDVAAWAGFHHEKLDGSGYPFHITSDAIDTGGKIMAVADIFTALMENRPYRKGLTRAAIEKLLANEAVEKKLAPRIVELLLDNYQEISSRVEDCQTASRLVFEENFRARL